VIAVQDLNQLRMRYSREEAEVFLAISGNLLCGQVTGDTADAVSSRFPRIQRERSSVSENESGSSVTTGLKWEPTVTPATIAGLSAGEFVGWVADDPGQEVELKAFHARLGVEARDGTGVRPALPVLRARANEEAAAIFKQVKEDIASLVQRELALMVNDASYAGVLVK
jgi:hypothetical protein